MEVPRVARALVRPVPAASGSDRVRRQCRGGRQKPLLVSQSPPSDRKVKLCGGGRVCAHEHVWAHVPSGSQFLQASAAGVSPPCLSHTETNRLSEMSWTRKSLVNRGYETEGPSSSPPEAGWAEPMFVWNLMTMKLATVY